MRLPAIWPASALLMLAVAACGQGAGTAANDAEDGGTVKVSVVPSIDSAGLYLGDEQGFFADEGLELEFVQAGSGPAAAASVVSNETQFGLSANVAILQARSRNVPLLVAAPAAGTGSDPAMSKDQVVVGKGSDIESFADLSGRKVAVVAVKNSPELFIRHLVDADGGDSSSIEFLEMPFAEMTAALEAGRVDAVAINEPFLTGVLDSGGQAIGSYIDDVLGAHSGYTYWFTSEQFAEQSPDTVEAFRRAMEKSSKYADDHPDQVRETIATYLDMEPQLVEGINLPGFAYELDEASFADVARLMEEYEFVDDSISTDALFAGGE